ncbi:MAG: hypothetical protein R3C05_18780 [Pirellulaceae bacterium]
MPTRGWCRSKKEVATLQAKFDHDFVSNAAEDRFKLTGQQLDTGLSVVPTAFMSN